MKDKEKRGRQHHAKTTDFETDPCNSNVTSKQEHQTGKNRDENPAGSYVISGYEHGKAGSEYGSVGFS